MQKLLPVYSIIIQNSRHKPNLENTSKYGFSPDLGGGEKWRRSDHAQASYPGLFFRPLGFSGKKGEFRDWTIDGQVLDGKISLNPFLLP